ncbi:hypothetical protein HOY82DRAFT_601990 [Tuber indicum]|nr:hypothetical protein HOY82DRAFT_601990 [Tuber indicum]
MYSKLWFHGFHHNGEDDICGFLNTIENHFDDCVDDYRSSGKKRSRKLAAYVISRLRGRASTFVNGLPELVCCRWSKLSAALEDKFDVHRPGVHFYCNQDKTDPEFDINDPKEFAKQYTHILILPPDLTIEKFKGFMCNRFQNKHGFLFPDMLLEDISDTDVTTFDLTLLEDGMSELIITTEETMRVLLNVLFVLRMVCQMIFAVGRIRDAMLIWEKKSTEQPLIDQLEDKFVNLDMEVDEMKVEISGGFESGLKALHSDGLRNWKAGGCFLLWSLLKYAEKVECCLGEEVDKWRRYVLRVDITCYTEEIPRMGIG